MSSQDIQSTTIYSNLSFLAKNISENDKIESYPPQADQMMNSFFKRNTGKIGNSLTTQLKPEKNCAVPKKIDRQRKRVQKHINLRLNHESLSNSQGICIF